MSTHMKHFGSKLTDFHEIRYLSTFRKSAGFAVEREMFHTEAVNKIRTHIFSAIHFFFSENRVIYEIMWKNMVRPDRTHGNTTRLKRFACWITEAMDTLRICNNVPTAFPRQQVLSEHLSM